MERYDLAATMYERHGDLPGLTTVRELAFRANPVAQIVVTGEDTVAMINRQAETMFGLSPRDIGRLLRDLEVSYRPVELGAYLEQAKVERRSARIQDVKWQRAGSETIWFEIHANPLVDAENGLLGVSIVFFDVTATRALLDKVVATNRQLEAAYDELRSTKEELETMTEVLQSTNDVLHTINDTLRERSVELDDARTFLDSLVDSVHLGMVVVDREMRVVVWNRGCEELWGLRADETTGQVLTSLDIGMPWDTIRPLIGNAFVDPENPGESVVEAVNRRGCPTQIRVTCTGFPGSRGRGERRVAVAGPTVLTAAAAGSASKSSSASFA
jgi:two-component system, chemotaxis family, CheB/CheR fusion protein